MQTCLLTPGRVPPSTLEAHCSTESPCVWGAPCLRLSSIVLYTCVCFPPSPCVFRAAPAHQRHSSQLQLWPGVCSHSPVLIEIPDAPGFTDNIRGARMQSRSREHFSEENGLLSWVDLAWPLEQGQNVGTWLWETEQRHSKLPWKHRRVFHWNLGMFLLTSPFKFLQIVRASFFIHLSTHLINIYFLNMHDYQMPHLVLERWWRVGEVSLQLLESISLMKKM